MGSIPVLRGAARGTVLRDLLAEQVSARFRDGYDEVVPLQGSWTRLADLARYFDEVEAGRMRVDVFLGHLTDEELLQAFERQCCQKYR